jgi:peptidoglycan/LPS O-acetylase OafA/YrhL
MGRTSFFSGAFLLLFGGIPMSYVGLEWNREFSAGIPAILLVYGAIAMERSSGFRAPRLLHTVGDASYSIYLSHILCLSACLHVWRLFIADGLLDNLIIVILMISVSLISGYASYRYVEVPLQNLFRGLFVQRHPPPVAPKLDSLG